MKERFEESSFKGQRYPHDTYCTKTCEYLESRNQIDIQCFVGIAHVDKIQGWQKIMENYFENMGIIMSPQVELISG